MLVLGLALMAGVAFASNESAAPKSAPQTAPKLEFEPAERYRFALGGESGQYTDAERDGIEHFDGLSTTITIEKVYGKPSDKWASIARINLFGPGEGENRKLVSVILTADRKTHHVTTDYKPNKDKYVALQKDLSIEKAIDLKILAASPGKLLVVLDGDAFEVDCDLDIKGVSLTGSGVDVRFEPFALLRRKAGS